MKKQKNNSIQENDENPFASSSGDLMAGLMFIFVLLLSAMMLQVQKRADKDAEITKEYNRIKTQLYIDLEEEFNITSMFEKNDVIKQIIEFKCDREKLNDWIAEKL